MPGISLRAETDTDDEFLRGLYASTRAEEIAQLPHWSDAQKNEFLAMQFDAQRSHYQENYPNACFDIIEQAGQPVGRLYLAEVDGEIRLMDIALLPARRNQGIGTDLTRAVLDFAGRAGLQVTLHVEDPGFIGL